MCIVKLMHYIHSNKKVGITGLKSFDCPLRKWSLILHLFNLVYFPSLYEVYMSLFTFRE